jgi:hypothetical protein
MSATDRLVEKNCRLAELRYLAGQRVVKTGVRVRTSSSGNRLGADNQRLTRLNLGG